MLQFLKLQQKLALGLGESFKRSGMAAIPKLCIIFSKYKRIQLRNKNVTDLGYEMHIMR